MTHKQKEIIFKKLKYLSELSPKDFSFYKGFGTDMIGLNLYMDEKNGIIEHITAYKDIEPRRYRINTDFNALRIYENESDYEVIMRRLYEYENTVGRTFRMVVNY